MGGGPAGYPRMLTRFFSLLREVRPMRKTRHPCYVKMRSCVHAELWLDSNLFVMLPPRILVPLITYNFSGIYFKFGVFLK
jgi:hypothetical protein